MKDVSFEVKEKEVVVIIGASGSGKSTLVRCLSRLVEPTTGAINFDGIDLLRATDNELIEIRRKKMGMVFQQFALLPHLTTMENVAFPLDVQGVPKTIREARALEVIELVGLRGRENYYPRQLSGGQQQRVGIARTLLHDPEVLIFDEPANGLDPEARIEMRDLLLRLAELGKTLIVTSHILPELSRICDEIAIISGGKLRASGTMAEINEQLGQMRMVEIHLHGAERIDEAQEIVRGHSDIAEIAGSKTEELIRFRANLTDQGMAQLLNSLVTANIPIAQFHEVQTDLEDAFLTVTKEDRAKMV